MSIRSVKITPERMRQIIEHRAGEEAAAQILEVRRVRMYSLTEQQAMAFDIIEQAKRVANGARDAAYIISGNDRGIANATWELAYHDALKALTEKLDRV